MRASVTVATADTPGSVFTMCAALGSPVRRSSSVRSSSFSSRSGCIVVSGVVTGAQVRAWPVSSTRSAGSQSGEPVLHVDEVVHRVVDEVAGERLDREPGAVAAVAGALPLLAGHAVEPVGERTGGLGDRGGDGRRLLLVVAVGDRSVVLVPVGEVGVVLGEHERQPLVVDAQNVAHVAGVLEGRPAVVRRARGQLVTGPGEDALPGGGVVAHHGADLVGSYRRGL